MTEEEKPVGPNQEAAFQQEQLPLDQSVVASEIIETPPAEPEGEKPVEAVAGKEKTKTEEFPAFAPIAEKAVVGNPPADGARMSLSKIVGIVIVLIVVSVVIFYATRQPAAISIGSDGQTVSVSDSKEQGKVSIIEEAKNDINVTVNNGTAAAPPQVKVTVYLGNTQKNPNSFDCSLTYPLEREIDKKYDSNMINTMLGLLEPLASAEKEQGYVSAIPGGTILKYLKLDDSGVMSVNLSGAISQAAGSCAIAAIKAQIKNTLLQFASIRSVVICIDGNCNEDQILQP